MFVSVVMPAYNAERFIGEAIDSVLCQTHTNFELIIADDGSSDGTLGIVQKYAEIDSRIRAESHENWGVVHTLNHAIDIAHSEWIARLDADDVMEPNRLERQVWFVTHNENIAVAASLVTNIDEHGREVGRSQPNLTTDAEVETARANHVLIGFHHPSVLMRKSVFECVGRYRPEFWSAEDVDLWNRIADAGERVLVQPEYLLRYRLHNAQISHVLNQTYVQTLRWIERCSLHRRRGMAEPTRTEFERLWNSQPLYRRLNRGRTDVAYTLYQQATYHYIAGSSMLATLKIIASTCLNPSLAPEQIWRKMLSPLISSKISALNQANQRD